MTQQTTADRHRWQGLDGLRAIAVTAVVAFHFQPDLLPGGYLGVDVFFVISGYLITRLLVEEFLTRGGISARRFYARRARRLFPALAVLLAVISASALIWRDQVATVRGGVLASAGFVANWWLALDHQSYFVSTGRPSMLQHLWSLGVEEQFYLIWPIVCGATLAAAYRSAKRRGVELRAGLVRLTALAFTLSLMSTALMWWLADRSDVPYGSDGSTLYYGTDTHCMGLLLGAALGSWVVTRADKPALGSGLSRIVEGAGWTAALATIWLFRSLPDYSTHLYRGGFLLAAALVAVVIAAITQPASGLGRLLDTRPMRWVGVRSYSIYLWHWPIAVVTRPGIDTTMPIWLDQLLRIVITVALAAASYRFIETPVRRLGFRASWTTVSSWARAEIKRVPPRLTTLAGGAMGVIALIGAAVLVIGPAAPTSPALALGKGGTNLSISSTKHRHHHDKQRRPDLLQLPEISGFGDSVLLDAKAALGKIFPGGTIDAVIGRQPDPILSDIDARAKAGKLRPLVIIHIGNNGLIKPSDLQRTLQLLGSTRLVMVFTDHLDPYDHTWQRPNNNTIDHLVPRFKNTVVVNWDAIAAHHRNWLYPDDLHLSPAGMTAYAQLVKTTYLRWAREAERQARQRSPRSPLRPRCGRPTAAGGAGGSCGRRLRG